MSSDNAKQRGGRSVSLLSLLMLAVIITAGVFLRGQAYLGTQVIDPLQGESADAYALAQTLSQQGAYQVLSAPYSADADGAPIGEAFGSLGYPLFLSLFVGADANEGGLNAAVLTQLVLSALAILLVFVLATRLLDPQWGLTAALLTAVSPFLVNVSLYLVGATLLMVALLIYLVTAAKIKERGSLLRVFFSSLLLGVVALVDPTFEFLIVFWVLLLFVSSKGMSKLVSPVAALLGFGLAFSPMLAQNQAATESPVAAAPIAQSLQQGMQPDVVKGDAPAKPSGGESGLPATFAALGQRLLDDPRAFLRWYLVDKTEAMWSWEQPAGIEEAFVYPVSSTPYTENPGFRATEALMRLLHGPLVLVAGLGAVLVWLPFASGRLTPARRIGLRTLSLVLLYATVAHGFGVAAPQYATPLLPLVFLMALSPLYLITLPQLEKRLEPKQAPAPAAEEANEPAQAETASRTLY